MLFRKLMKLQTLFASLLFAACTIAAAAEQGISRAEITGVYGDLAPYISDVIDRFVEAAIADSAARDNK